MNKELDNYITEYELKKLSTSEKRSEAFADRVHATAEFIKEQVLPNANGELELHFVVRDKYYQMKDRYQRKSIATFAVPKNPSKTQIRLWNRVLVLIESSGVTIDQYLEAQFQYFHQVFGRCPRLQDLLTDNAVLRATTFVTEGAKNSDHKLGAARPTTRDVPKILKLADAQMRQMCKTLNKSRFEVYRDLVIPGLIAMPKEYLKADPEYSRAAGAP